MARISILAASAAAFTVFHCSKMTGPGPGEPPNIARDGTVSASAVWENNPAVGPQKVIDGSTYEDSGAANYWLLPNRTKGWWQVDLGREFRIATIRLYNTHNGSANDRATKEFRVEVLDSSRAPVFSQDGILPFTGRSGAERPVSPYEVKPGKSVVGRYVKIHVDGWYPTRSDSTWPHPVTSSSNASNEGGGLQEVQVLGTPK